MICVSSRAAHATCQPAKKHSPNQQDCMTELHTSMQQNFWLALARQGAGITCQQFQPGIPSPLDSSTLLQALILSEAKAIVRLNLCIAGSRPLVPKPSTLTPILPVRQQSLAAVLLLLQWPWGWLVPQSWPPVLQPAGTNKCIPPLSKSECHTCAANNQSMAELWMEGCGLTSVLTDGRPA